MPDLTEFKFEFTAQCDKETADRFFADLVTLAEKCNIEIGGGYWQEDTDESQSECCRVQKGK